MQDPYTSLNPRMTVGDIIGEPFEIHPDVAASSIARGAQVRELLDLVGLNPEHINRYPHQFSGGQRQRIGIARALALDPERHRVRRAGLGAGRLDPGPGDQPAGALQARLGLAYIFIAHDLSVVRHISDRVAVMYLGQIVETGTDDEIYERANAPLHAGPAVGRAGAGSRQRGTRRVIRLEGDVPSPADPPSGCRFRTRCWKAQARCAEEQPALVARPDADPHPSACHFAERI